MKRLLIFIVAVQWASGFAALAQTPDEQYVLIYNLIQDADRMSSTGQADLARAKFSEAQTGLKKLQSSHPYWNEKVVRFRLRFVEEKLSGLSGSPVIPVVPVVQSPTPVQPGPLDDKDYQIRTLQEAVRQLENERAVLEAKLKEALTAQPAVVDAHDLARAEERLRAVEKEKELLRVAFEQERSQRSTLVEPNVADGLRNALAEANRQLVEQKEAASVLAREKELLENRLKDVQAQNVDALRVENDSLRRELSARPAAAAGDRAERLEKDLADARSALEANARMIANLRDERAAFEKARSDLERQVASAASAGSREDKAAADRIKRLEKERDDLQARLDQASKPRRGLFRRDSGENDKEVENLRARVAALEAQKVPYTREELALFKEPPLGVAKASSPTQEPRPKALPPGAAPLLNEAETAFAARRFDEAERKYQEVLKLDENNAATLANLAAAQLEQNRTDEAEATLRRALDASANDPHALTMLGILKFRQTKFDDALDALSRASQIDPKNPETQNYLGITLSQKGQRGAAETALRKAVQLAPGYGGAHHNLAVVYATQQPPFLELARFHYDKALSAGHPRNAEIERLLAK